MFYKMKKLCILSLFFCFILLSCQVQKTTDQAGQAAQFKFLEAEISDIRKAYETGELTAVELVKAYLARIEELDRSGIRLNSILHLNPDAIAIAGQLDKEMEEGKSRGPMHGIPVVLKDNIDTGDGMPTTAGSRAMRNAYAASDAFIVRKLRDAGAIIIAKANLSEWANFRGDLSSSGWSGLGGQTKNPYVLDRNPCGSSSGSAVAVAANLSMLAIGTETNGSIVCPSNNNGIVGIKPTVGLLSRSGIIPIAYTQDSPGPMARTVTDAAICLGAMVGVDSSDNKTLESEGKYHSDYSRFLHRNGLKGKKIGHYTTYRQRHFKVDSLMTATIEFLKSKGAQIIEIEEIGNTEDIGYYSLEVALYEFKDGINAYFQSLAKDAPVKELEELIEFNKRDTVELQHFNQRYLEMAQQKAGLETEAYKTALATMLKNYRENGIDSVMDLHGLDAIIAPTGNPAWKTDLVNGDASHIGSSTPSARAGYPIISVPAGMIDGLPVNLSFFGRAWSEPVLLEIAYAFEQGTMQRKAPQFKVTD